MARTEVPTDWFEPRRLRALVSAVLAVAGGGRDGDDGLQTGIRVVAEHHFLMAGLGEGFKDHAGAPGGIVSS